MSRTRLLGLRVFFRISLVHASCLSVFTASERFHRVAAGLSRLPFLVFLLSSGLPSTPLLPLLRLFLCSPLPPSLSLLSSPFLRVLSTAFAHVLSLSLLPSPVPSFPLHRSSTQLAFSLSLSLLLPHVLRRASIRAVLHRQAAQLQHKRRRPILHPHRRHPRRSQRRQSASRASRRDQRRSPVTTRVEPVNEIEGLR